MLKTIDLDDEQIKLTLKVLREKVEDLNVVLKNSDGLSEETIRDLQLEHRDINNVIRELQFYSMFKDAGK